MNVSSPKHPGLRALQDEARAGKADRRGDRRARRISARFATADLPQGRARSSSLRISTPSPALPSTSGWARWWVSNTTISRPALPFAPCRGRPAGFRAHRCAIWRSSACATSAKATGGAIPLVGVGGIATAEDAWQRIRAGASLVQLYSAMVYEGPGLGARIVKGLEQLMRRDGFPPSIAEAVGSE